MSNGLQVDALVDGGTVLRIERLRAPVRVVARERRA